ncbi:MAG TPA: hypothetical protein VJ437_10450 [Acidiferrobacterales bacterium]|nr:hypothetical protein [Acidiferrobacterales bacterium]
MRNALHPYVLTVLIAALIVLAPHTAVAAVNLPWSTSYNCPDWKQSDGLPSCDGLLDYGSWTCDNGDGTREEEQITAAANYPGGGGGKGQRSWDGDGTNNNSGATRLPLTNPQPELWIRFYMRYPLGFRWDPYPTYEKWLRVDTVNAIPIWYGPDKVAIGAYPAGQSYGSSDGTGWNTVMVAGATDPVTGLKTGDGLWHWYEVRIRINTPGNADGVGEIWIDGIQRLSRNDIDYRAELGSTFVPGGWTEVSWAHNQTTPGNGRCVPVDYDDVAIRAIGPIGPVGPADTLAPAAPSNLTVQ